MKRLINHPVLLSVIVWACALVTFQVVMLNLHPDNYSGLNQSVIAVIGILSTVLMFAAKWSGRK